MTKLIRDIRRKQRFALYFPNGHDITVTFDENRNPRHCFDESSLPFIETLVEDEITFLGQIKNL